MNRIYAQLALDDDSKAEVVTLLQYLRSEDIKVVPENELHLSLIHVGIIDELYERMKAHTDIPRDQFDQNVEQLATEMESLIAGYTVSLRHVGYDLFGANGQTLVATFDATAELSELHFKLYSALLDFLVRCNIEDPKQYALHDKSLMHAQVLRPHVTLARSFKSERPSALLGRLTFCAMKVRYDGRLD